MTEFKAQADREKWIVDLFWEISLLFWAFGKDLRVDSFHANSMTIRSGLHWDGWVADVTWGEMEVTKGKAPFKRTGLFKRNAVFEGDYCVHYQCNDPLCTSKKKTNGMWWFHFLVVLNTEANCFSFWGAGTLKVGVVCYWAISQPWTFLKSKVTTGTLQPELWKSMMEITILWLTETQSSTSSGIVSMLLRQCLDKDVLEDVI